MVIKRVVRPNSVHLSYPCRSTTTTKSSHSKYSVTCLVAPSIGCQANSTQRTGIRLVERSFWSCTTRSAQRLEDPATSRQARGGSEEEEIDKRVRLQEMKGVRHDSDMDSTGGAVQPSLTVRYAHVMRYTGTARRCAIHL
jgi:hypothetical protein